MTLIKLIIQFWVTDKTKLLDQTKFRLDEIRKIENYFNSELMKENYAVKNWANMLLFLIT